MNKPNEIEQLQEALNNADCLSQGAFEAIGTICEVALIAMEQPAFWRHTDTMSNVLLMIKERAADAMNTINCEAEQMGCNWTEERSRIRHDARQAFLVEHQESSHG